LNNGRAKLVTLELKGSSDITADGYSVSPDFGNTLLGVVLVKPIIKPVRISCKFYSNLVAWCESFIVYGDRFKVFEFAFEILVSFNESSDLRCVH
jgi:hypothetical protein